MLQILDPTPALAPPSTTSDNHCMLPIDAVNALAPSNFWPARRQKAHSWVWASARVPAHSPP